MAVQLGNVEALVKFAKDFENPTIGDFLKNNDIIRLTDYALLNEEEYEMRDFLKSKKI